MRAATSLSVRWPALAAGTALALVLAACGGGGGGAAGGDSKTITLWTLEDVQARIDRTQKIVDAFGKRSGVKVDVVPVAEDQFSQLISSSAAAGDLPDVIAALGLSGVNDLAANELLDTGMAASIVKSLGPDTFSRRALKLTQDNQGNQLAVPSDGWAQLLFYRKDLFDKAGLAPPTTYDSIRAAAQKLNSGSLAGITAATAPGDSFTQQTFEHLALANGCQLVDGSGKVTLNSGNCVNAIDYYTGLMSAYGPAGNQNVDTTRATYFAGKAAMVIWSSFLLDELAGLRNDALPTCAECRKDPGYLAKNSGIVSAVQGPDGSQPAQYGEIVSWAVTSGANPATADLVKYMMDAGYVDWLSLAPEGKVPVRRGTANEPTKFIDAWPSLQTGQDKFKPLNQIYDKQTLQTVATSPDTFQRWGFEQGQGGLAGAMLSELPVPKALASVLNGGVSPQQAAQQAQSDVQRIADTLG